MAIKKSSYPVWDEVGNQYRVDEIKDDSTGTPETVYRLATGEALTIDKTGGWKHPSSGHVMHRMR